MKISVRNLEPTKVKLTVTVEPEELNPYLDAARKEIAKQVNVPGFRKGHVPGKIIDQRIGFAAVAGEAVNDAVPELYSKALDEKKIRPMAQPEFDVQDVPQSANDETDCRGHACCGTVKRDSSDTFFAFVAIFFVIKFIQETRGRTLEEMSK